MAKRSRAEKDIERRIAEHGDDPQRLELLNLAARFKRSWVELGEVLHRAREQKWWEGWGFGSFVDYCRKELHIRKATADKLTASFGYLTQHAPEVLERDGVQEPIPQPDTIHALARAREAEQVPDPLFNAIQADALASDLSPASLARRFKEAVDESASDGDQGGDGPKQVVRAVSLARRLADLLADLQPNLPDELAADVEEQLGRLIRFLDQKRPSDR
jgi:hypothetical protein